MRVFRSKNGWLEVLGVDEIPRGIGEIPGVKAWVDARGLHSLSLHWTTTRIDAVSEWLAEHDIGDLTWSSCGSQRDRGSLYPHQRDAVRWLLNRPGGVLADVMGLGKTRSAIAAAEAYAPSARKVIVGPKFVKTVWLRELIAMGAIEDESQFCALMGRDLTAPFNRDAKYFFVHYDVVGAWWSKIVMLRPQVGICDEAHLVKSPKAQRSRGAKVAIGACPFRILLTGTPILNRVGEFWTLLDMAGGTSSFGSQFKFRERYCGLVNNGYGFQDGEPSNVDEFRTRLPSIYLRRTADEAKLDMPKLTRTVLEVEPLAGDHAAEQESILRGMSLTAIYEQLCQGAGTSTLRALAELRKLTSEHKLATTVEAAVSALDQGDSVVVFAWERRMAELLAKRIGFLAKRPTEMVHGGVDQEARDAAVDRFQRDGGAMVATIDSLGVGVTLTRARIVILHDLDWTPADLLQAEGRICRIGQTQPCQAIWVICKDSIDVVFARLLMRKASDIAAMTGDSAAEAAAQATALQRVADDAFDHDVQRLALGRG